MSMLSVNFQESDDAGIAIEDFDTLTPLAQDGCLLWMLARRHSGESLIIATGQSDDVTFQATQRLKMSERWPLIFRPAGPSPRRAPPVTSTAMR